MTDSTLTPSQEAREALIERVAVALSMADPDERGLPEGEQMAPFYRKLAHAAVDACEQAIRRDEAEKCARQLEPIYHVLHCIYDECEDEGDRIYLGSTNDHHTLKRQLRRIEKLFLLGPAAIRARHADTDQTGGK